MRNYPNAGDGLRKIYYATIGSIICSLVTLVPGAKFFAAIGVLVCAIVTMVGFWQAGKDIEGCKIAFVLQICSVAIGIIVNFVNLPVALDIIGEFLPLIAICLMCYSVSQLMRELGATDVAKQGMIAMFVYIACEVAAFILAIYAILIILRFGFIVYILLLLGIAVLELVFYLKFLKNAAEQLGSY